MNTYSTKYNSQIQFALCIRLRSSNFALFSKSLNRAGLGAVGDCIIPETLRGGFPNVAPNLAGGNGGNKLGAAGRRLSWTFAAELPE